MSNTLAIAAVTDTLRNLLQTTLPALDATLGDLSVTTRTPDMARKTVSGSSLNVFLYATIVNAAWRNQDPPQLRPGETGTPPLALNLHYLLTAYGRDDTDQDAVSHRVLAAAMSVLHDHPVLDPGQLAAALANNDVGTQFERVRFTPLAMGLDEASKLWTAIQSSFRLSAAYEAAVVLIDSTVPGSAALPVLARGSADQGVQAVLGGAAVLTGMVPPRGQAATELGGTATVTGSNLAIDGTVLRFTSTWQPIPPETPPAPVELAPAPGTNSGELAITIPDLNTNPAAWGDWVPGFYTVTAVAPGTPALVSNAAAFALAPAITLTPHAPATAAAGDTVTVRCAPRIGAGQRVLVVFGNLPLPPATVVNPDPADPNFASSPTIVTFQVPTGMPGTHPVRLRVDGVDSIPVTFAGTVPTFDPAQQVVVP